MKCEYCRKDTVNKHIMGYTLNGKQEKNPLKLYVQSRRNCVSERNHQPQVKICHYSKLEVTVLEGSDNGT